MNAHALFVADVHLCESRPAASARFFDFLRDTAAQAKSLYILGDLFESWVGDDDLASPLHQSVIKHLADLSACGVQIFFMHGNRDFMLAEHFAHLCGMQLLSDPVVVDLYGTPTLLTHGDTLCTADVDYQRYRRAVRHPWMLKFLRALPLRLRQKMAQRARAGSEQAKTHKSAVIMDVDPMAVIALFEQYRVRRMIHGHTHRPAQHNMDRQGVHFERWVLPDWYDNKSGYIVCNAEACQLVT
ncbi:MAG: UDP-2,3-diacylglucosamine diphosphatase [Thiobacillus sp.]